MVLFSRIGDRIYNKSFTSCFFLGMCGIYSFSENKYILDRPLWPKLESKTIDWPPLTSPNSRKRIDHIFSSFWNTFIRFCYFISQVRYFHFFFDQSINNIHGSVSYYYRKFLTCRNLKKKERPKFGRSGELLLNI